MQGLRAPCTCARGLRPLDPQEAKLERPTNGNRPEANMSKRELPGVKKRRKPPENKQVCFLEASFLFQLCANAPRLT